MIWLKVFRGEATNLDELCSLLPAEPAQVRAAVDELLANGRLKPSPLGLESTNVVLPLGAAQGWEAAILDHFRAVAVAIGSKVRAGPAGANAGDRTGGSTFTFTVDEDHPHAEEVYDLLRDVRLRVQALWDRVSAYNDAHAPNDGSASRVTFYVGQSIEEADADDEENPKTAVAEIEVRGIGEEEG